MVFGGEVGLFEEIGAVAQGFFQSALAAPAADLIMIATGEDVRDGEAAEVCRPCVVGIVEQSAGAVRGERRRASLGGKLGGEIALRGAEALIGAGGFVAEDAGDEAHGGVNDDGCRELATRENVVADGEFLVAMEDVDAFVDAFVAATDEYDAVERCEPAGDGLGKGRALCGEQDNGFTTSVAVGFWGDAEGFDGFGKRFGLEDHAFAAAEGAIVNRAVTVVGEVAKIVAVDGDEAVGNGAAHDTVSEDAGKEFREDSDDIEAHDGAYSVLAFLAEGTLMSSKPSGRRMSTRWLGMSRRISMALTKGISAVSAGLSSRRITSRSVLLA